MAGIIDNVIENSMSNGLQTNLKSAIETSGGEIPENTCLWQYPEIIRKQLIAKTVAGLNLIGKDIIHIESELNNNQLIYNISTLINTDKLSRPNYAYENSEWNSTLSLEKILNDLFSNILPAVRGIYAGDMTVTDKNGNDTTSWENKLFNKSGNKTGLLSSTKYIRLYLTCQAEPIYINIGNYDGEITNKYNIRSSDTIEINFDEDTNSLYANVNIINKEQLNNLGI